MSLAGACAFATQLHISPTGNDAWSGSLAAPNAARTDGPLASLQGATDRLRALRMRGKLRAPIDVTIADGTYEVTSPLVLKPEDSGSTGSKIVFKAARGTKPIFSSGLPLTDLKEASPGLWQAKAPVIDGKPLIFEQLYVNGRRAIRARTPNAGYSFCKAAGPDAADLAGGTTAGLPLRSLTVDTTSVAELQRVPPDQLHKVVLVASHSWETSIHHIAAVNSTGTVLLTGPAPWEFNKWGPNQRYYLENYPGALDQAGEWYVDPSGTLFYKPLPGEDIAKAKLIAPVADSFIRIEGDPDHGRFVTHVSFEGLRFENAGYVLPPEGHADAQAAYTVPAVFQLDGAQQINFDKCAIAHIGIYGTWFRRGCTNCSITNSLIEDMGAGGVRVGEASNAPSDNVATNHIQIENNIIRSGGRIFAGAIGVWIGQSGHNKVLHNEIADLNYTGISIGWSWGYAPTQCDHNDIGYNHIHHIGWNALSDMGGIYTLGLSEGTNLHHNLIHNVYSYNSYGAGGWGIYNDEGSTSITVENNVVYDTDTPCYHQHYGSNNVIRNNIFVSDERGLIQVSRPEPHLSDTFEKNILYWGQSTPFAGKIGEAQVKFSSNLFWRTGKDAITSAALAYGKDLNAFEPKSFIADPGFIDAANHDFRLKPGSPATRIGFKPFDYKQAGVYGSREWQELAARIPQPPAGFVP